MEKKRIDFKKVEILESGAKFYKGIDCAEGYYHVCNDCHPKSGKYILSFMPEIYRHDTKVSMCIGNERHIIKFCPLCGKQLAY